MSATDAGSIRARTPDATPTRAARSAGPMVRVLPVLLAALVLGLAALRPAPAAPPAPSGPAPLEAFVRHLDERVPALMERYGIPGVSLALVQDGAPAWAGAWGLADVASGRPMTPGTYGRAESISKSVTAWGVMTLVEDGQLGLDGPVVDCLDGWAIPETPYDESAITPRLLLGNAAGLPLGTIGVRYDPAGPVPDLRAHMTGEAVLQREPGTGFEYSNAGFNLLEILLEDVTGEPFAAYMDRTVLDPLGMSDASFTWSPGFTPPVATGYDPARRAIPVYIYPDRAAGGLFATVHDLAAFAAAGMAGPEGQPPGRGVLEPASVETLYAPITDLAGFYALAFDGYAMGHLVETLPDGRTAVAHGGQGSGWMSHFHAVPESGAAIVIMTNSQRAWPFFAHVLGSWADWIGADRLGMEVILQATAVLRVLIALILLAVLVQAARLVRGWIDGRRRFGRGSAAGTSRSRAVRSVQAGLGVLLVAAVAWVAVQPYSFLTAIFPSLVGWLGWTLLAAAGVLLASAAAPVRRPTRPAPGVTGALLTVLLVGVGVPGALTAQEDGGIPAAEGAVSAEEPADTIQTAILPTAFYSPETSLAVGALYARIWRASPDSPKESSSGVAVTYTLKNQLVLSTRSELWPRPEWQITNGFTAVLSWPDRFYPVGNDAGVDAWEEWVARRVTGQLRAVRRIGHPSLFVGPVLHFGHFAVLEREDGGLLDGGPDDPAPGAATHTLLGGGVAATWDSRDATVWPTRGGLHTLTLTGHTSIAGAGFDLGRVVVDLRKYDPLGPGVLALHGRLATVWGDVPFTMHGTIGGLAGVRGVYEVRFADRTAALAVAEYRLPLAGRFGAVVFAGAGRVAPSIEDLAFRDLHTGAGAGLRFTLLPASRLNVGVDLAAGPDGTNVYIMLGEAF